MTFSVDRTLTFPRDEAPTVSTQAAFDHRDVVGVQPFNMFVFAPYSTSGLGSTVASFVSWLLYAQGRPRSRLMNTMLPQRGPADAA